MSRKKASENRSTVNSLQQPGAQQDPKLTTDSRHVGPEPRQKKSREGREGETTWPPIQRESQGRKTRVIAAKRYCRGLDTTLCVQRSETEKHTDGGRHGTKSSLGRPRNQPARAPTNRKKRKVAKKKRNTTCIRTVI